MKKCWLILLALTVVTAVFAYEVVAWHEDFEGDISEWTHYDGAESPNMWHIHEYGGAQGTVWWMGDPDLAQGNNIGGYYSAQYLVLDTPARTLNASNATLTFKMRYKVEDPGGTGNFNVWDSMNIRVSTDNGTTWTVITGTPAYSGTSSYAFGQQHGEGPGIPAWGGSLLDWTTATFDLSAYVGQSVKVRFAFASDPAYDTTDDRSLFGMMVDDISFGGYTNNGVDDGQMTYCSMVPLGGDLWHLATDPDAPSPTHVMKCGNPNGTYNPNMFNFLVSPAIELPASGDIKADFMLKGDYSDSGTFPDVDYHGWEISVDGGTSWFAMSNPYGDPSGSNYVYSSPPTSWGSMLDSYNGINGYISDYAGQTVRFRWYFKSNDTVNGWGYMIDDVKIYNDIYIEAPSNLTAEVDGNNVVLNWELGSFGGGEEGWLGYCSDVLYTGIGTSSYAPFEVAIRWDPSGGEYGINPYVGMQVTKIKFIPASLNPDSPTVCDYTVRLYTGATGEMVYEQPVPSVTPNEWNEIVLTTPWTIPPRVAVWAGYHNAVTNGYPAGCDDGPAVNGYGNMINMGGSWSALLTDNINYNWNIRMYVQDANGKEYVLGNNPNRGRDVSSYQIYRNSILIDERDGSAMTYTDPNVAGGLHSYYVTAKYGEYESGASNTATVFVIPDDYAELNNDDGTAEAGFNIGSLNMMGSKYEYGQKVKIEYAKVYVHTPTSAITVRIYDDNGPDGMPGAQQLGQFQMAATSVVQGWNYIPITSDLTIEDGTFYVVILDVPNSNLIGLDTSANGHSYTKKNTETTWKPLTTGELMIRAIVKTFGDDSDENDIPMLTTKLGGNYPNPFNPETTISYSLKENQNVKIEIYNVKGQLVRTLVNQPQTAGDHTVIWTGTDNTNRPVASGLYYYKMTAGKYSSSKKMILMK